MSFTPMFDRILVKPDTYREDVSSSGIVIKSAEKLNWEVQTHLGRTGTVVAVGKGKISGKGARLHMDVKPGDKIAFGEFEYKEYAHNGEKHLIMQEADICWIFEE